MAARWNGHPDELVGLLVDSRLIDEAADGYRLHQWDEHQPWATGAAARSEAASRSGQASAAKRTQPPTLRQRSVNGPFNGRSTDPFNGSATPSPSPSPKREESPHAPRAGGSGTGPVLAPGTPANPRPRRARGTAPREKWAPQIATAIGLWKAAAKAHGQDWKLGGDVETCLARQFERDGGAEKAHQALARLANHAPKEWHTSRTHWSLAWLCKTTDCGHNPVNRMDVILEGGLDETVPAQEQDDEAWINASVDAAFAELERKEGRHDA